MGYLEIFLSGIDTSVHSPAIARMYDELSEYYEKQYIFSKAIDKKSASLRIYNALGDVLSSAECQYKIGIWYYEKGLYHKSLEYADMALRNFTKTEIRRESWTAGILPENTQDKTITWSSSDTETASVDENGLITGIAKGDAVITASIADIKAECMVHVTETLTAANVGDWYYSDGTWSTELDPSKTPVALVFWAGDPTAHDAALKNDHPDCTHGLAVALSGDEPYMFWPLYAGYGMMLDDYRLEKGMDLESTQGGTAR